MVGRCPPYVLALVLMATPVAAVQPDEILADPALEARAREISRDIRCPVCQGEIDRRFQRADQPGPADHHPRAAGGGRQR